MADPAPLLSPRERAIWAACVAVVFAAIVFTHFHGSDGDSTLYASMSERLSHQPLRQWIAPPWFGIWEGSRPDEVFIENPAGIYWIPAALARIGIPADSAAYALGALAGLAALLALGRVVTRVTSRADGRAALVLLQFMPIAFIFRVRNNHEYFMLIALAGALIGADWASRSWWRGVVMLAASLVGGAFVKAAFVLFAGLAAVVWIAIDPLDRRARAAQLTALSVATLVLIGAMALYDVAFAAVTGSPFWVSYFARQLAPVSYASLDQAGTLTQNLTYYLSRLLWHPAPWSLALAWLGVRALRGRAPVSSRVERRSLFFALTFVTLALVVLSLPSRHAERYIFSGSYVLAAAGAICALRMWPRLARAVAAADAAVPALPALVWTALTLGRVFVK